MCPVHGEAFEVEQNVLTCRTGPHSFPIRNGIPRFVDNFAYSGGFGTQWEAFPRTQLDSCSGFPISRNRLLEALGQDLWQALPGSRVLEVGCGAGRFTEILEGEGAEVWSVDLSSAVDVNVENCPLSTSHLVLQADLDRLPFKPSQFDMVCCLGVLQHTPSPETSILQLSKQVKPGGVLVLDHYSRNWKWLASTKPLARFFCRRMSPERGLRATNFLYRWFAPLHRRFPRGLPRILLHRISPITFFSDEIPALSESQKQEWGLLDTHDSLTDFFKHRRTTVEIATALSGVGLIDATVYFNGSVVVGRGVNPGAK